LTTKISTGRETGQEKNLPDDPQTVYTLPMIWFPLALSAAVCWAVGAVLVKRGISGI